jgi:hypothetical protein
MNKIIRVCNLLDKLYLFSLADKIFLKYAEKEKDIMDKRILIPSEVKKIAEEAYKKRNDELKFGNNEMYEIARLLSIRTYLEMDLILDIHKYTYEKRYSHSKSKKNPTYWEYQCYGGDDGKKWASDIIKIYLPKKWKAN